MAFNWTQFGVWIGIIAGILAILEACRHGSRWLRRKLRAKDKLITLGAIDPNGYDPELPGRQSELASRYLQHVQHENMFLTFPGVVRSLPLEKILVTPRLGASPEILLGQADALTQRSSAGTADPDLDRQLDEGAILPWLQLRELAGTFVVIGPAGTGKTTLLHHEAFVCAEALVRAGAKWEDRQNPVPVILRADEFVAWSREGKNLRQAVHEKIVDALQMDQPLDTTSLEILQRCIDGAWEAHSIRLLLDAFDEIGSEDDRTSVLRMLQSHLSAGGCPFILASRPLRADLPILHQTVRTLYLAPFDASDEMPRFIENWFGDIPEKADVRDSLRDLVDKNRRLAGVCRTPLLLAFLCLAAEYGDVEPFSTRVGLYRCLLKGLLETWPKQLKPKRVFTEVKYPVLRHIGWLQLARPESLAGNELIKDLLNWSENTYQWNFKDAVALLTELTDVDCVLHVEQSFLSRDYSFFHPTVAEYFAALEATENDAAREQLFAGLSETRWHGAFAMFVAMNPDPLPLIRRVADSSAIDSSALSRLIDQCISECADQLATEAFAECAWIAQSLTPLPWTNIAAYEGVCMALELLSDDGSAKEMLSLLSEIRDHNLVLPKDTKAAARRLQHGIAEALTALDAPHSITRWAAMWVLAFAGDRTAPGKVAALLTDPDPTFRGMAAWLLSILEHKASCSAIRRLLQDPDWMVRRAAASALGRLEDDSAFEELLAAAQNDRAKVRSSAVWSLSKLASANRASPDKLPALKSLFVQLIESCADPDTLGCALSGMAALTRASVDVGASLPRMQSLLDNADSGVRGSAAYAIAAVAVSRDAPLLESMAANPDPHIRASAASGLGRLKHAESTALLIRMMTDHDSRVQRAARWALYQFPDQNSVEAELINVIQTADESVIVPLVQGLVGYRTDGSGKPAQPKSLTFRERPAVIAATQDRVLLLLASPQADLRASSAYFLAQFPAPGAVEPCLKLLGDSDPRVRASALNVLQRQPDPRTIEPCLRLLSDPDPGVLAAACGVFQQQLDPRAVEPCLKLLRGPDPRVRASACGVFQLQPDPRAIEPCLDLLSDPDPRVRAAALNVLQRQPDPRTIEPCLRLLSDPDPGVLAAACGVFAHLPLPPSVRVSVLQILHKLLADPDERVRRSSKFAIRALTGKKPPTLPAKFPFAPSARGTDR